MVGGFTVIGWSIKHGFDTDRIRKLVIWLVENRNLVN